MKNLKRGSCLAKFCSDLLLLEKVDLQTSLENLFFGATEATEAPH